MPTINKRFLLKLVLVLFASTVVLFAAHAVQARRIPAALKLQSERAADAGKLDHAVQYLRQYLEFHPDDVDAQVRLAEMLTRWAPTYRSQSELLFLYDKILNLEPARHAIRRQALAVSLRLGRNPDAVTHATALLKVFPDEAGLWQQLGTAQAGMNDIPAARQSYEAAVAHAPDELVGYQRLAQLVWKNMNDAPGARDVLDRMVKALPQEPDAFLIRARFETYTAEEPGLQGGTGGDLGRARRDLLRVLELDPEHAEASLLLAEIMQRTRNIPAAHALLRDAVALYPRDLKLVRALSWLELIRGNAAAAITVLEDGVRATPDGFDLMVPLADLLVQQGDTVRTAEIIRRLQEHKAPPTQVKYLKARVAMRERQWPDAVAMLDALRAEIVNLPGLDIQLNLLLATCFQKLGDPAAEEKAYQRVTNADPKNVLARVGLGNLYLNAGRLDDAARELETAVQSPYATGVVVTQWVRLKTRLLLRAAAPGEWQKLDAALANLTTRFGRGSSEPAVLRAEIVSAHGRPDEAARLLRKEAAVRASDPQLWAALALTTADASGCAAGLAAVDEGQAAVGDCVELRLVRAALYAREPGHIRPIESIVENVESWPDSEQLRLLYGLVEVYEGLGDRANVVRTLQRMVVRQPVNVALWLKLHERAAHDHAPAAAAARTALVKIEGTTGHAVVLCDAHAATTNAAAVAERVIAAFGANPTRADACLALARLKRLTGDTTAAGVLTERAFLLEPTSSEAVAALLTHFMTNGAANRAGQLVGQLAADPRWAGDPFRRVIGRVLPAVPPPAASVLLTACRPLVEREPGGPGWVAECAASLRQPDALVLLDHAATRPGATADDWLRKALYMSKDDVNAGPEVLAMAKAKLSGTAYASLVAVYTDSAAGSTFVPEANTPEEKRQLAQARLSVKLSRTQPAAGAKILEEYLAEPNSVPADADWARRNLAMIYAVGGTQADRDRAMRLLKGVSSNDTATPEQLRATVSVLGTLARYLEGPDRRAVLAQAIAALEAVHKTSKAPTDLFAMAQLYQAAGDRPGSRRCLQQLLNRDPAELANDPSYPLYLTAAMEELVEDRNFTAAGAFAGKLTQLRVGDFRSLAAIARFEAKAGHPERGLAVAEDYARLADSSAGDYLARSARVAELLDELSRLPNVRGTPAGRQITNAAVQRFAAIVPTRPDAIVGLAGALAADGRVAEAFEHFDRLARYIPARLRATAGLAVVRGGPVTDRQAEQVRQWLDACLVEEPDSVPLLLNRAEFLARRRDTVNAVAAFERVLAREGRSVVALNNLAWLLAADPATAEKAVALVARATREGGLTGDLLDTRARVRITLKQFDAAERDLAEAISHDPTALRWFHVAVLRTSQTPPSPVEAGKAFAEAHRRGIDTRSIHPADLPTYRAIEAARAEK